MRKLWHYNKRPEMFKFNSWEKRNWGGDDEEPQMTYQFQPDPYVQKTQDFAYPYYTSLLEGKPNAYYGAIGESGGAEYQKMLNSLTRNASNAASESAVRRGMGRSGLVPAATAQATADMTSELGWNDYLRAMEGRKTLLSAGMQGLSDVGGKALQNQEMMNKYGYDVAETNYLGKIKQQSDENKMWSEIISGVGGGIGTAVGMIYGGPWGAAAGSQIGSKGADALAQATGFTNSGDYGIEAPMRGSVTGGNSFDEFLRQLKQ